MEFDLRVPTTTDNEEKLADAQETSEPTEEIVRTCAFVRASGRLCRGLALTDSRFCYFHSKAAQRRRILRDLLDARRSAIANGKAEPLIGRQNIRQWDDLSAELFESLDLPPFEDASSCVAALSAIGRALESQQISDRKAAILQRIIRTSIMLHAELKNEQHHSQWDSTPRVNTNPDRPGHYSQNALVYDADGEHALAYHPQQTA
jgi:hypothetical protein